MHFLNALHHPQYLPTLHGYSKLCESDMIDQEWETCGLRKYVIWPASEFLLPMLEYNIVSKQSTMIRYLDSKSREVTLPLG